MQGGGVIIEVEENLRAFFKSYRYENDEQRIITLQTFSCWMTVNKSEDVPGIGDISVPST